MYGSQVYGGSAYANIDEVRRIISPGPSAGTTPSGQRVSPRDATISRLPRSTPTRTAARVEPMVGQAILSPEVFANQWLHGIYSGKHFILTLTENYVHTVWPTAAEAEALMYVKKQVKFEGTEASPEVFTTNAGKLVTMETGVQWPTFNSATHIITVEVNASKYQETGISIVKDSIAVVTGNVQFQAYIDSSGNAATDGFFYGDVKIQLQVI